MEELVADYCVNHPRVETVVHCSRCEKPICPKCMISTPVGMRCRQCANLRRSPVYDVRGRYLWQALAAGAGITLAGGFLFDLTSPFFARGLLLSILVYLAVGTAIGELISRAANRKHGRRLQAVAIVATTLTLLNQPLLLALLTGHLALNVLTLLLVAAACVAAWNRLR